jgi:hypothetical protein
MIEQTYILSPVMERLDDPDFAFFLGRDKAPHTKPREREIDLYMRGCEWRLRRGQTLERDRIAALHQEFRDCSFRPSISHRARSITSCFRSRLAKDLNDRKNQRIIFEFMKMQNVNERDNHSFSPDLSSTNKFKLSRYITSKIKIPILI